MITAKARPGRTAPNSSQFGSLPKSLYEEPFATYQGPYRDLRTRTAGICTTSGLVVSGNTLENTAYLDGILRRLYLAEKGAVK